MLAWRLVGDLPPSGQRREIILGEAIMLTKLGMDKKSVAMFSLYLAPVFWMISDATV